MSDEDKRFDMSGRKQEELRKKGTMPKSLDIPIVVNLSVGFLMMLWGGGAMLVALRTLMAHAFSGTGGSALDFDPLVVADLFKSDVWYFLAAFCAALYLSVFFTQVSQVGLNFIEDALSFRFNAFNPINGFNKVFSKSRLVQVGQNLLKLALVGAFTYQAIGDIETSAVFSRPLSLTELGKTYIDVAWALGWRVMLALAILAGADYFYQVWKFAQDNKMTLQEVKEEAKSYSASPEIIRKRKMAARKLSLRRMMENMHDATVVITNPTHYAVALKYKRGETEAPILVAKAIRLSALRIKERAYELRIPVRENKPLAQGIYKYGAIDRPIPPLFYQGVAVILAALYRQGFQPVERPEESTDLDETGENE